MNDNDTRIRTLESTVAKIPAGSAGAQFISSFDFEEATTSLTTADASNNGNTLTVNNVGSAIIAQGHSRNGLLLDGISGYAYNAAPKLALREELTVSAWVFRTAAGGASQTIIAHEGQFSLGIINNSVQLAVQTETGPVSAYVGTGTVPLNSWTHVMGSYDGVGIRIFVNGMLTSYTPYSNGIIKTVAANVPLRIGNRSTQPADSEFLTARVDEVRISPTAEGRGMFPRFTRVQGYAGDDADNGLLAGRALTVVKRADSTGLRIVWSDNFRVQIINNACRWEVLFNGTSCTNPGSLVFDKYEGATTSNRHDPSTFVGTCVGLAAGNIAITTRVGPTPAYSGADCYTGWKSQLFSIEAEEVQ